MKRFVAREIPGFVAREIPATSASFNRSTSAVISEVPTPRSTVASGSASSPSIIGSGPTGRRVDGT
jgi:hypothetical protein